MERAKKFANYIFSDNDENIDESVSSISSGSDTETRSEYEESDDEDKRKKPKKSKSKSYIFPAFNISVHTYNEGQCCKTVLP